MFLWIFSGITLISIVLVLSHKANLRVMLCVEPSSFKQVNVIRNPNYILLSGYQNGMHCVLNILNVYAPFDVGDRRTLWMHLLSVISSFDGC